MKNLILVMNLCLLLSCSNHKKTNEGSASVSEFPFEIKMSLTGFDDYRKTSKIAAVEDQIYFSDYLKRKDKKITTKNALLLDLDHLKQTEFNLEFKNKKKQLQKWDEVYLTCFPNHNDEPFTLISDELIENNESIKPLFDFEKSHKFFQKCLNSEEIKVSLFKEKIKNFEFAVPLKREGSVSQQPESKVRVMSPEFYFNHPNISISLGSGIDPNHIESNKFPCVDFTSKEDNAGAFETKINTYLVKNESELRTVLGIDNHAEARFLSAGASAHVNYSVDFKEQEDRLIFVVVAESTFPSRIFQESHLNEHGQKMINEGRFSDFSRLCGSEVVHRVDREVRVNLILEYSQLDQQFVAQFNLESQAKGKFGPISGSLKSKLNFELQKSSNHSQVNIEVNSLGGEGLSSADELIASELDFKNSSKLEEGLKKYLSKFTKENAAPYRYWVSPMESYGLKYENTNLVSEEKTNLLLKIIEIYRETENKLNAVGDAFKSGRTFPYHPYLIQKAYEQLADVEKIKLKIAKQHQKCLDSSIDSLEINCSIESLNLPREFETFYNMMAFEDYLRFRNK